MSEEENIAPSAESAETIESRDTQGKRLKSRPRFNWEAASVLLLIVVLLIALGSAAAAIYFASKPVIDNGVKTMFAANETTELLKKQVILSEQDFRGNGETILIVDDVKEQRDIAILMFSQLGYQILGVESGEEAVDCLSNSTVDSIEQIH